MTALTVALAAARFPADVGAQLVFSAYGGLAHTADTDLRLSRPGGTDLTFHGVSWNSGSLDSPFYYGLRATYWHGGARAWGIALDFTHAKMFGRLDDTLRVSGTRADVPVDRRERLRDTFGRLAFTHGHNLLTLNLLYRRPSVPESRLRVEPYVGAGLGIAVPHVEANLDGTVTDEYQLTGPVLQALAAVGLGLSRRLTAFAEYKVDYAQIDGRLSGGGALEIGPWTHQLVLGLSFTVRAVRPNRSR